MKKNNLLFFILLVTGLGKVFGQLTPDILYYKFDGSGTAVPNLATAATSVTDTATLMGALTQGGNGLCKGALIGTGGSSSNDYLNTNWTPNITGSSWTISFRTSNVQQSTSTSYIFGDVNSGSFRCFTGGVAGAGNWILRGPITDVLVTGGASLASTMTTFVYDSIAGNIKAYLNGTLINTIAQTSANISGTGPFKVGGYSSSTNLFAGGLLDEFRLYKYALTATEIAQLYNPYASVGFLGLDKSICPGDSVQLSLNWPVDSVVWSTGDTVENIWAKNIATYIVGITGACGVGADTITLNTLVTTNTISAANCDTYMSPSGKVFTVSGMYTDTLSNNAGCDSLLTINLSIKNSTSAVLSPTVCYSYTSPSTNYTWTVSGAYMDTIANSMGCDSMLTINLIVNTVNSAVTQAGIFLSASTAGATYKWLDCNNNYTPIANATSQSYTATANGSYAVEITNLGCADTSACYPITGVSVIESTFDKVVSVYPNPSNGTFIIDLGENQDNVTVIITDAMGRVVLSNNFGHISKIPLVLNESAGIYFVQIYSGSKRALATLAIE